MTRRRTVTRAGAAAAVALTALLVAAAPARASLVSEHLAQLRQVNAKIRQVARHARVRGHGLDLAVARAQPASELRPGRNSIGLLISAYRKERAFDRSIAQRLLALEARRSEIEAWLWTWGVFRVCPVDLPRIVYDDYGDMVDLPDVPLHVHRGSDIQAPTWTPIRAPFDGYAASSSSPLGGYQVRVHGDRGYVFNAHLISFGQLGWVRAGTVVGYVGSTGDATGPHDHFEWHPDDGPAVDPYDLLRLSCG